MALFSLPASGASTGGRPQLLMQHSEQPNQIVASCLGEKKQLEKKREKMLTFSIVEMFISFTSVKNVIKMKIKDLTQNF